MKTNKSHLVVASMVGVLLSAGVSGGQGLTVESNGAVTVEENGTSTDVLILQRPLQTAAQLGLLTQNNLWYLRAHGSGGKFRIDEANTAGTSFELAPGGALTLASGLTTNGVSQLNGNVTIGTSTANASLTVWGTFSNPSSRTFKTDIAPIDSREMLRKVAALPVYAWRYKADAKGPVQIGPMAEDFRDVVGVGDGKFLVGQNTAGVSLAAIRGLNEVVEENRKELAELRTRNAQLVDRVAALETRLEAAQ